MARSARRVVMPADLLDPDGYRRFGIAPAVWRQAMDQQNAILALLRPESRAAVERLVHEHRRRSLRVLDGSA